MPDDLPFPVLIRPEQFLEECVMFPVTLRSGDATVIKLVPPPARVGVRLLAAAEGEDFQQRFIEAVVAPEHRAMADQLDVMSWQNLVLACQQLALGVETQKKILQIGRAMLQQAETPSGSASSGANASAPATDGPPETSPAGVSPA